MQDKLVKTIIANYILWPGAHFINFRFVPSEHRILCVAVPLCFCRIAVWGSCGTLWLSCCALTPDDASN